VSGGIGSPKKIIDQQQAGAIVGASAATVRRFVALSCGDSIRQLPEKREPSVASRLRTTLVALVRRH
jgi:hypothetical protein